VVSGELRGAGMAQHYGDLLRPPPGFDLGGGEIFLTSPDRLWVPPSILHNGCGPWRWSATPI